MKPHCFCVSCPLIFFFFSPSAVLWIHLLIVFSIPIKLCHRSLARMDLYEANNYVCLNYPAHCYSKVLLAFIFVRDHSFSSTCIPISVSFFTSQVTNVWLEIKTALHWNVWLLLFHSEEFLMRCSATESKSVLHPVFCTFSVFMWGC